MTTTPQSMSDLPELPEPANPGYHTGSGYYTADQLREYGRLCRANAEQAGKVEDGERMTYEAAQESFTAYFVKNYPGPTTIISDPRWHAPRLFRIAYRSFVGAAEAELTLRAKPTQPAAPDDECDVCAIGSAYAEDGGVCRCDEIQPAATQMPVADEHDFGLEIRRLLEVATDEEWSNLAFTQKVCDIAKAIPSGEVAAPVSPSREVITPAELWAAVDGNPGITPTKQEALDAARLCAEAADEETSREVEALRRIVKVLGPVVPNSVTDEGARWEWQDALDTARNALAPVQEKAP